jgi:hypothetical protein
MKKTAIIIAFLGLIAFTACKKEKEPDMTVKDKTLYENAVMNEITAEDAWCVQVIQDSISYVELKYSAFLEEYLRVTLEGASLHISLSKSVNMPNNTVMNAIVHTPEVHNIHFSEAVTASVDGRFPETALTIVLEDASTCRGGHFFGSADIKLSDASKCVEFSFEGTTCKVEVSEASDLKCSLNVSGDLNMTIKDGSHVTDYWGEINHANVTVTDASHLNMATSWISYMHIDVKSASEATVNVTEILEGSVQEASKLYYSGDPVLIVDCDDTSIIQQVEYPNPNQ